MNEAMILTAVGALYRERMIQRIGADVFGYLEAALGATGPTGEFRSADIARIAGVSRARASQVIDKLLAKKVVRRSRREISSKYLVLSGEMGIPLEAALRACN